MTLDPPTLRRALGSHLLTLPDPPPPPARGVRFHSDRVRPGDAFVALAGATTHGLRFADDALARGAAFVLSDRPRPGAVIVDDAGAALLALGRFARAAHRGPVVAVTGSAGKTTTKALLAAALDAFVSSGNLNTPYALATVLVDAWLATDADRALVLELGIDHPGEMARLTELVRPTHGLVTLIAPAHLEGLGDLDGVAREKAGVLRAATVGRYAADAAWARLPADLRDRVQRYRVDPAGRAGGSDADPDASGTQTHLTLGRHLAHDDREWLIADIDGRAIEVELPGVGRALAENALGALRVAVDLGVPPATVATRLATARLEPGRLTRVRLGDLLLLDDTYNANPASVAAAFEVLARAPRPHAAVLGSMLELGPAAAEAHRDVGRACLAQGIDPVWTVGGPARDIAAACPHARRFIDADAAADAADELPATGTLLVKGSRGVRLEVLVARLRSIREERPWSR